MEARTGKETKPLLLRLSGGGNVALLASRRLFHSPSVDIYAFGTLDENNLNVFSLVHMRCGRLAMRTEGSKVGHRAPMSTRNMSFV
jgi:hypothetical protein